MKAGRLVAGLAARLQASHPPCAATIVVDGIRPLPLDKALQLAHRIADECTP